MTRKNNLHWSKLHEMLAHFKEKKGHTNVPASYEKCAVLGNYVKNVRQNYAVQKEGREPKRVLENEEIHSLDSMGFKWRIIRGRAYWENLDALKQFKTKFGHCNIPDDFEDQLLVEWSKKLRSKPPSKERVAILAGLGFQIHNAANDSGVVSSNDIIETEGSSVSSEDLDCIDEQRTVRFWNKENIERPSLSQTSTKRNTSRTSNQTKSGRRTLQQPSSSSTAQTRLRRSNRNNRP